MFPWQSRHFVNVQLQPRISGGIFSHYSSMFSVFPWIYGFLWCEWTKEPEEGVIWGAIPGQLITKFQRRGHGYVFTKRSLHEMAVRINTWRPRQNGRHFPDDIFKCIFLNENVWNTLKTSMKFVPRVPINNIPALDQIMAWRRIGDKPLSGPMMVSLLTQICVNRPQWVKN